MKDRRTLRQQRVGVKVDLEHTLAPDASERLRRAFELVLRAAARAREQGTAQEGAPMQNDEPAGWRAGQEP